MAVRVTRNWKQFSLLLAQSERKKTFNLPIFPQRPLHRDGMHGKKSVLLVTEPIFSLLPTTPTPKSNNARNTLTSAENRFTANSPTNANGTSNFWRRNFGAFSSLFFVYSPLFTVLFCIMLFVIQYCGCQSVWARKVLRVESSCETICTDLLWQTHRFLAENKLCWGRFSLHQAHDYQTNLR